MPKFGTTSQKRLDTCHPDLQKLMQIVVKGYDCSVLEGVRTEERQRELFNSGRSKTMNSKHLHKNGKSRAIDVVPYPIAWGEKEQKAILQAFITRDKSELKKSILEYRETITRFYYFAGYVKGIAAEMGIKIRWGGDWDGDNEFSDQSFHDLPHFEIVE